ncbi:hypothetical protein A4W87_08480 [Latilactobacillus sakei]|uniref:Na+ dependent nucleoside transporter N-terminal domain-containing protein n=1 Tax=Latilactobacillus sakei TaxID=1599 RepID=UPI0020737BF2|nr:Na+ dependent nucleoside transporter N-terminal domain-containing protein [Latilactobacillus sakei]USG04839.1 hypothetical protein A4W87_08480 [Latilactobacillus sakei]
MSILMGIVGLVFIFAIGWLVSSNRKKIRYKQIGILLVTQFVISFLCLHTSGGVKVLAGISNGSYDGITDKLFDIIHHKGAFYYGN